MPILMVATFREVESDMGEPFKRALAALSREPYVSRIALRRFFARRRRLLAYRAQWSRSVRASRFITKAKIPYGDLA